MDLRTGICNSLQLFALSFYYLLEAFIMLFVPNKLRYKDVKGQTVLVTGAGSGIGRGLSERFAKLGCKLVLWDIDDTSNKETGQLIRGHKAECHTYTVDLSNREQIYATAEAVRRDVGDIDILVNNAGIVTGRNFLQSPDQLIEKTMAVNVNAHFWTVKSFLPSMVARNHGHIVTVSSSAGLFGVKGLADYCASKFAAVGLHESLLFELDGLNLDGVHVTAICPYFIDTGMFEGAHSMIPMLKTVDVLDKIIDGILVNKAMVILPWYLSILLIFKTIMPVKWQLVMGKILGTSSAMEQFKGRSKQD